MSLVCKWPVQKGWGKQCWHLCCQRNKLISGLFLYNREDESKLWFFSLLAMVLVHTCYCSRDCFHSILSEIYALCWHIILGRRPWILREVKKSSVKIHSTDNISVHIAVCVWYFMLQIVMAYKFYISAQCRWGFLTFADALWN